MRRLGLTLFEVCMSTLLVSVAILAALLLLPVGAKTQQMARYQMFATAKANELIESFAQSAMDLRGFSASWIGDSPGIFYYDRLDLSADAMMEHELFSGPGQFDLERAVVDAEHGNYPVPIEIARRLESPGDEIQDLLDGGGQIYYCEPYATRGFSRSTAASGGKREASNELQHLVWAVKGCAQQDALPLHPMAPAPKEFWPFPPQAKTHAMPRRHAIDQLWEVAADSSVQRMESIQRLMAADAGTSYCLYQGNNWEWLAQTEVPAPGKRNRWADSLHEFRRLVNGHWMRLYHQLSPVGGVPQLWRWNPPYIGPAKWNDKWKQVGVDPKTGAPQFQGMWQDANGLDMPNYRDIGADSVVGCPSPAIGLPLSSHRGTDIMNEDQETARYRLTEQVRYALPSLERRVMYRTAALALWAKVQGPDGGSPPASIHSSPADDLMRNPDADPNVADQLGSLPSSRNPLAGFVPPPSDPRDIHPAQVLALSYLAHAAMMVTGYKPPFVDDKSTPDAADDENLVPDETQPYKALYAEDCYLRAMWSPGGRDEKPLMVNGTPPTAAQLALLEKDVHNRTIAYRRYVGPILNPYPAPYADRGAFDMAGKRTYTTEDRPTTAKDHDYEIDEGTKGTGGGPDYRIPVPGVLRVVTGYSGRAGEDSQWARNAYETFMAWGSTYLRENPYDLLVPRPLNQQTMMDRPLYAWDLFDEKGKALRSRSEGTGLYAVTWGGIAAAFGAQWAWPICIDDAGTYSNYGYGSPGPGPYEWGSPDARMAPKDALDIQARFANQLGALHGFTPTGGTFPQPFWNAAVSPRRDHYRLNDRFAVADRTRELVFWSVDWKAYADAESLPSAPSDYTRLGRRWNGERLEPWWMHDDDWLGNPERLFVWTDGTHSQTALARSQEGSNDWDKGIKGEHWQTPPVALGAFGADRNGNGAFDVGPVPPTTRMRALEVARFNFYDPVAPTSLRQ